MQQNMQSSTQSIEKLLREQQKSGQVFTDLKRIWNISQWPAFYKFGPTNNFVGYKKSDPDNLACGYFSKNVQEI